MVSDKVFYIMRYCLYLLILGLLLIGCYNAITNIYTTYLVSVQTSYPFWGGLYTIIFGTGMIRILVYSNAFLKGFLNIK